jgi:hypothetical protein
MSAGAEEQGPPSRNAFGSLRLLTNCASHAIALWEDVVVSVWRDGVRPEHLQEVERALTTHLLAFPEGVATLTLVDLSSALGVDQAMRDAATRTQAATASMASSRVLVLEGEGFQASAVRSILIGIGYMRSGQAAIVGTAEAGCSELARQLGRSSAWCLGLERALATMRRPPQ